MAERFINRSKGEDNYFVLSRKLAQDSKLTWEARGVLMYLLSKPPGWIVRKQDLINQSKSGSSVIERIFKELVSLHYMYRKRVRNSKGHIVDWVTYIFDSPEPDFIFPEPICQLSDVGKLAHIVNIENTERKERERIRTHWALRPKGNLN